MPGKEEKLGKMKIFYEETLSSPRVWVPIKIYRRADLFRPVSRRPDTIKIRKSETGKKRSKAQKRIREKFRGHEEGRKVGSVFKKDSRPSGQKKKRSRRSSRASRSPHGSEPNFQMESGQMTNSALSKSRIPVMKKVNAENKEKVICCMKSSANNRISM